MLKRVLIRENGMAYRRYRKALEAAGAAVCTGSGWRTCDGLLLPGGGDLDPGRYGASPEGSRPPDLRRDQEEWELLEAFLGAGKPVLAICRGMQVVNVFLGGSLIQDLPGHSQWEGRDRLHRAVNLSGPLRRLYGPSMWVNSAHHQCVDQLGQDLQCCQRAPDGVPEALEDPRRQILGVQWHPERLMPQGEQLFRAFVREELWG